MKDKPTPLMGLSLAYEEGSQTIRVKPGNWMLLRQRHNTPTRNWVLDADMSVPVELAAITAILLQQYEFRYGTPAKVLGELVAAMEAGKEDDQQELLGQGVM